MKTIIVILSVLLLSSCSNYNKPEIKLIPVKSGDNWGYVNKEGEYIINPQFMEAHTFSQGLALVKSKEGKFGFIGKDGLFKIDPIFKESQSHFTKDNIICVVPENGKPQFIDLNGKIKFVVDLAENVDSFREGFAAVKIDEKWGFIDIHGNIIIKPKYDDIYSFSEKLCAVGIIDQETNTKKWGFINQEGELIINFQFSNISNFKDGLAAVSTDGETWGYIDKYGKYEINPTFDYALNFTEGCALVKQGNSYGYIDKNGKYLINPQFNDAYPFTSEKVAPAKNTDGKWGYIDKSGRFKINPQFDSIIVNYFNKYGIVKQSNKFGIIDNKGKYYSNPQFDGVNIDNSYNFITVKSDYLNFEKITNQILENTDSIKFRNILTNTTLKDILNIYHTNEEDIELNKLSISYPKIDSIEGIVITNIQYFFNPDTYVNKPIYETNKVEMDSDVYYYDTELIDYEKEFNYKTTIVGVTFSFALKKFGKKKSKYLADQLRDSFRTKGNLKLMEHTDFKNNVDNGMYILKGNKLLVNITYQSDLVEQGVLNRIDLLVLFTDLKVDFQFSENDWIQRWKVDFENKELIDEYTIQKINNPTINGKDQVSFDKSLEKIMKTLTYEEQEKLKDAIGMLVIFGTGPLDENKEIKWNRLRFELNGMTAKEVLEHVEKRSKEDYN